ncbi:hypothetical protein C8F01DRAFT_1153175 [Mycena amicta]|nr:hypothetical protein C8F01DRAFT_1153175 [Mycena amicta]
MYAYKLAILGLCSTAVVWAYPNAKALALVVPANANLARQIHNADYHAASPPTTPNQAQAAAEASPSTSPNETANPKPDANSKPDASSPASTPAPIAKETPKDKRENSPNSNNAQNNVQQAQIDGVAPQERSTLVSRLSKIASDATLTTTRSLAGVGQRWTRWRSGASRARAADSKCTFSITSYRFTEFCDASSSLDT